MTNTATKKIPFVLLFNANGLKNHILKLQSVLNNKCIDIALITETHFTSYSHIRIPGYRLYKANHPVNTVHGGVAILVKSTILHQSLPSFCKDIFRTCALFKFMLIMFQSQLQQLIHLQKHNISYENFLNYFNTINNNFIIGGDYNAKHQSWGYRVNNPRGNILYNFINSKNSRYLLPPEPTYWPSSHHKNPDILDIFVIKTTSSLHYVIDNILDLNSDHSSVILTINDYLSISTQPLKLFHATTDRYKFHDLVN